MASPNPSEPDQARLQQLSSSYKATNATNSNNTSRPDTAAAAVPARDYTYPPPPTLSNRFQDIDDPAALLESLASFDQVVEQANVTNHQFERLLQAAATADDAETSGASQNQRRIAHSSTPERADFSKIGRAASTKRKRSAEPEKEFGLIGTGPNNAKKRKKVDDEEEDLEEDYDEDYAGDGFDDLARERDIWGPDDDDTPSKFEYYTTASAVAEDARTAGVHSAAALFRRPSAASKKYTRPPMSKLFTSLELTPEQFLHLQAAAKAYMLNEAHPERRDCVGGRHRGDTDMTKLRLFACVKSFLEDEGWGERCFGKSAPGAEARKLKYPQMKNKIISLITPLLRRMVTNERQRLYAVETRKQNAGKVRQKRGSKTKSQQGSPQLQPNHVASSPQYSGESRLSAPPVSDPNLNQNYLSSNSPHQNGEVVAQPIGSYSEAAEKDPVRYHINLLNGGRRARPKSVLRPKECQGFASLVQLLQIFAREEGLPNPNSIQVMGSNGLIDVKDEASWTAAIDGVKQNDWMDGDVRVIAQAII